MAHTQSNTILIRRKTLVKATSEKFSVYNINRHYKYITCSICLLDMDAKFSQ